MTHVPTPLRVFIASSKEALHWAQEIQDLIYEEELGEEDTSGIIVKGWWSRNVFCIGQVFIESLERVLKETDASIIVATEDDKTTIRGRLVTVPRDNIAFESGMAIATHGRFRTAIAVIGKPKLPSDLDGVTHLMLVKSNDDFRERNRGKIRALVSQWKVAIHHDEMNPATTAGRDQATKDRFDHPDERSSSTVVSSLTGNTKTASALVEEIKCYSASTLSKTNLIRRYKVNQLAVPKLLSEMKLSVRANVTAGKTSHLVTAAEYRTFENTHNWRLLGYNVPRVTESEDGTKAMSGLSDMQMQELVRDGGASPHEWYRKPDSLEDEPVRAVSWYDAVAYCLSVGGRLPTSEELNRLSMGQRVNDVWEWTSSWFDQSASHLAVFRPHRRPIGVNPDLRLPKIGFRVIFER